MQTTRPQVMGRHHVVTSTHYLATAAGARLLDQGGNAVDAGVAAGVALSVVERHLVDLGGIAPTMVHRPGMANPEVLDGVGRSPARLTDAGDSVRRSSSRPVGVAWAVVPGAIDAWFTALARHGRMPLADVLAPSIELAHGFPVSARLARGIQAAEGVLRAWPSSASVFLPGGRAPQVGDTLVQEDLARLLECLADTASAHAHLGHAGAIAAARDEFYLGATAQRIGRFLAEQGAELTLGDLADHQVEVGVPVTASYRHVDVHACGPWSQGPVLPLTLKLLEGFDLKGSDPEDPSVLHRVATALELALADREGFFGDPHHIDVPIDGLLHPAYIERRRREIGERRATDGLPAPGDPWPAAGRTGPAGYVPQVVAGTPSPDTGYVAAIDADGMAFSATPSDGLSMAPLVPGLGIMVSPRGSQLWTDPEHPSAWAARKRPRITPNPALLLHDGRAVLAFGCPGADAQCQAMVQVVCHLIDRGMDVQTAIEAPRLVTLSAPESFHPHASRPGVLAVENRIGDTARRDLERRGHMIEVLPAFAPETAAVCAVRVGERGSLEGGADPRRDSQAIAR